MTMRMAHRIALDAAVKSLEVFTTRFGNYPYKELDVISSPMQALGIEYPGIIGIGIDLYQDDEKLRTKPQTRNCSNWWLFMKLRINGFIIWLGMIRLENPGWMNSITQYATSLYYIDRLSGRCGRTISQILARALGSHPTG